MNWRDSDDVTCFVCGLRYATIELYFLRCPCRGYTTRVRLQLRRVQEGSAVESSRARMERVLSEL
jgi:cytochrome c oxidase assembly protein Cox11